jgi:hypothetical protein
MNKDDISFSLQLCRPTSTKHSPQAGDLAEIGWNPSFHEQPLV